MIRILGRSTSGNVQKVLFFLEEVGLKYTREDYGRQFNNTNTDVYRKLNPNMKVPTLVDGDLVAWESHTILRYLAALHAPHFTGASPAERTHVERWMDWNLGALNTPYVAVFKDAKKSDAERGADFAAQAADLVAQLKILDGFIAGKSWFALDRMTLADISLAPVVARCLGFPIEKPALPELTRWMKAIEARPAFAVATGAKPSALNAA
ncbi:MAG TPA: glutathione S-transferase family protein [Xanthobacteraceae bacterium]|nr:glutathione S-transferase family protein [Xanthobacteraceae bacterium]